MKLASLKNDRPDGRLIVVSRDLRRAVMADAATTLIEAIRDWRHVAGSLQEQAQRLEDGSQAGSFEFDIRKVQAPMARAPQWLDASAFKTHSDLVAQAWGNRNRWSDLTPLMYQGASDDFLPADGPSRLPSEQHDIDFEGEVAVVVDEVPMAVDAASALDHVRLVMIANDVSLRAFGAVEQEAGFGFLRAKPSTVFSPVAVTPDELGDAWRGGRLLSALHCWVNGRHVGSPAASHMHFHFGQLIAHAATSRRLSAGTIIGSGTVSDPDRNAGSATLLEVRAIETIRFGDSRTPFLRFGDRVRIDVLDDAGHTVFGPIDHAIEPAIA